MPGGSPRTNIPKPDALYSAPNAAPTSGRGAFTSVHPAKIGGAPDAGYAHTCTRSTPLSRVAAKSSAQPLSMKGCVTRAAFDGTSIHIAGRGAGAGAGAGDGVGDGDGLGAGAGDGDGDGDGPVESSNPHAFTGSGPGAGDGSGFGADP